MIQHQGSIVCYCYQQTTIVAASKVRANKLSMHVLTSDTPLIRMLHLGKELNIQSLVKFCLFILKILSGNGLLYGSPGGTF